MCCNYLGSYLYPSSKRQRNKRRKRQGRLMCVRNDVKWSGIEQLRNMTPGLLNLNALEISLLRYSWKSSLWLNERSGYVHAQKECDKIESTAVSFWFLRKSVERSLCAVSPWLIEDLELFESNMYHLNQGWEKKWLLKKKSKKSDFFD